MILHTASFKANWARFYAVLGFAEKNYLASSPFKVPTDHTSEPQVWIFPNVHTLHLGIIAPVLALKKSGPIKNDADDSFDWHENIQALRERFGLTLLRFHPADLNNALEYAPKSGWITLMLREQYSHIGYIGHWAFNTTGKMRSTAMFSLPLSLYLSLFPSLSPFLYFSLSLSLSRKHYQRSRDSC